MTPSAPDIMEFSASLHLRNSTVGLLRVKDGAFELPGARNVGQSHGRFACLFAAVPAQGRAAGVMCGIASLGAATTFARVLHR